MNRYIRNPSLCFQFFQTCFHCHLSQVIRDELVAAEDSDGIDEFDSVSTSNKQASRNKSAGNMSPGNDSQDMSDFDGPSYRKKKDSSVFQENLVKKYTLTNTNRGFAGSAPSRGPIPAEFMFQSPGASSVRSSRHGARKGPPIPSHMFYDNHGSASTVGSMAGSMRATSSVRVVTDPRTRMPILERTITQPVPVPVPVYQPPPPPQIIHEVKPIYIPQPPEASIFLKITLN